MTSSLARIKCKIGLHSWVDLGQSITLMDRVRQCRICKVGEHDVSFGAGTFRYTPEAMKEAWDAGKITNPKAHDEIYG